MPGHGANRIDITSQKLGSALDAGNLDDTKKILADLQKNIPPQPKGSDKNPIITKINDISEALDVGDLKAAQSHFEELKEALTKTPRFARDKSYEKSTEPYQTKAPSSGVDIYV